MKWKPMHITCPPSPLYYHIFYSKNFSTYTIHKATKFIDEVFNSCSRLTNITIPDGVRGIVSFAFFDCDAMNDVYYTGTEEEWEQISIGKENYSLTFATIHYNYLP